MTLHPYSAHGAGTMGYSAKNQLPSRPQARLRSSALRLWQKNKRMEAAVMTANEKAMLKKVKANLILQHDEDDTLLLGFIAAAINYAETYQHKPDGHYAKRCGKMTPTTEQAVIMLSSHFYESRDGSTGGFFADNVNAAGNVWQTVNRLLVLDREVKL